MGKYINVVPMGGHEFANHQAALAAWDAGAPFYVQGYMAVTPPWGVRITRHTAEAEGFTMVRIHWAPNQQPVSVSV